MTRKSVTDEQYGKLQRRLGEVARRVDEGSVNFEKTMNILQQVVEGWFDSNVLPTKMTISGRTYDIIDFLQEGEFSVKGEEMVKRANEISANLGENDARHILEHQDEIPIVLRDKVDFIFTDWRKSRDSECVFAIFWEADHWIGDWFYLIHNFGEGERSNRLLRRK